MRYLLAGLLLTGLVTSAAVAETTAQRLKRAAEVVSAIMKAPDQSIPKGILDTAVCVAVVPGYLKGAFVFGGSIGKGALVCRRGGTGPWGPPAMFTLGGGSFGLQIGGSSSDVVLVVMNADGARTLLRGKVKLGADAAAAAGPVGRRAEASTGALMHTEILSYSRSRGVFAGLSLSGAVIKPDEKADRQLYGRRVTTQDILFKNAVGVPAPARPLDAVLTKYSPHGGQKF